MTRITLAAVSAILAIPVGRAAAAEPPETAESIRNAPAGAWTEIQKDDAGGRVHSKVVYAPGVNALVLWGARDHSKKLRTYDTEFFDVAAGKWVNAIPAGKEAEIGEDFKQWPGWSMGGSTSFYEWKGLRRPRPPIVYNLAAWDQVGKRVLYYCSLTCAYDPAGRAWTEVAAENGPPPGLYGGAMCYDAHKQRVVLFGGFGVEGPEGRPGTWFFDCAKNQWSKPAFGPKALADTEAEARRLGICARALRRDAQYLMGLIGQEREKAGTAVSAAADELAADILKSLPPLGARREAWSVEDEARAAAGTKLIEGAAAAVKKAKGLKGPDLVAALEEAEDLLYYRAVDALRTQPPPRCNTPLVCDPRNKLIVVFGGDHLDMKLGDTWVLDAEGGRWHRRTPATSPPPQELHGMCYLEKSGLILLASPLGNWTYDAAADQWKPVAGQAPGVDRNASFSVAGLPGTDLALGVRCTRYHARATYVYKLGAAAPAAGHKAAGEAPVAPFSKETKLSRKWYDDLPAPDPAAFAARLKALPENEWTPLESEKEIRARTWSSCTYDSARREIIYWGGGHSGNVNSNVDHFSMRTGRWSRNLDSTWKPSPFGAMAACPHGRTYYDEPWTMHARKTYAYDPVSGTAVMAYVGGGGHYQLRDGTKGRYTWIYDPRSGAWTDRIDTPFRCGYNGAAVTTPKGVMLLDEGQVWLLSVKERAWSKVGTAGKLPSGEYYTMVYDSRRKRLVYLAGQRNSGPEMHVFPVDTGVWEKASPEGEGCASRDAVYVPGQDAILAHAGSGKFKVYLSGENKWIAGPAGTFKGTREGISEHAVTIDPAAEIALWIDANGFCGPFTLKALKLNAAKLPR